MQVRVGRNRQTPACDQLEVLTLGSVFFELRHLLAKCENPAGKQQSSPDERDKFRANLSFDVLIGSTEQADDGDVEKDGENGVANIKSHRNAEADAT